MRQFAPRDRTRVDRRTLIAAFTPELRRLGPEALGKRPLPNVYQELYSPAYSDVTHDGDLCDTILTMSDAKAFEHNARVFAPIR